MRFGDCSQSVFLDVGELSAKTIDVCDSGAPERAERAAWLALLFFECDLCCDDTNHVFSSFVIQTKRLTALSSNQPSMQN
jgi:hypothetical protein